MTARTSLTDSRLNAAIGLVVSEIDPDQIILFGSAARNEMTPASDIDLLAIRRESGGKTSQEHWKCTETGDRLDVVIMDRATAERHRLSAYYVQGAALEEGRTVYARPSAKRLATGPNYCWNGKATVGTTKFEPDHAKTLLEKAERRWKDANRTEHPADKCEFLQQAVEGALKALIVANGRRVEHTHELNDLWTQAETDSDRIAAAGDPAALEKLSRYAGAWRYEVPNEEDPGGTWEENRRTGEDIINDARRRVPTLVAETRRELQAMNRPRMTTEHPSVVPPPPQPQRTRAGAQTAQTAPAKARTRE